MINETGFTRDTAAAASCGNIGVEVALLISELPLLLKSFASQVLLPWELALDALWADATRLAVGILEGVMTPTGLAGIAVSLRQVAQKASDGAQTDLALKVSMLADLADAARMAHDPTH